MKAFFSAQEISRAIGITDRAVHRMADRKRWEYILRPSKRGGRPIKFFRRKNIPERILLALEALDNAKPKRGMSQMISRDRRRQLKAKLGVMIDLAWRNCERDPEETLTDEEQDYLRKHIDGIIKRLNG